MQLPIKDILYLQHRVAYLRDEVAYKKLFINYYNPLHRFATAIVKNNELAEEMVSDTMMKVWDAGTKLALVEKLDAYLFTAIKNSCLTYLHKQKLQIVPVHDVADADAIHNETAYTAVEATEIEKIINVTVSKLPPQCLMVYKLIKEEGFSYKKVSCILEISQNTLETHIRIALKRIKAALSNYLVQQ